MEAMKELDITLDDLKANPKDKVTIIGKVD